MKLLPDVIVEHSDHAVMGRACGMNDCEVAERHVRDLLVLTLGGFHGRVYNSEDIRGNERNRETEEGCLRVSEGCNLALQVVFDAGEQRFDGPPSPVQVSAGNLRRRSPADW